LLSKLLRNEVNSLANISNSTDLEAPVAKDKRSLKETNLSFPNVSPATEFSNAESNDGERDARKIIKSQNSDEFVLSVKGNSVPATESSNVQIKDAMKNSNLDEIHDTELNSINISISCVLSRKISIFKSN
jgi:hypothetical protein